MSESFFTEYALLPIILFIGLIGNLISVFILTRKRLEKIGARLMYIILFAVDSLFLLEQVIFHFFENLNQDLTYMSPISCKFFTYMDYSTGAIPPMTLVYISIEQYVSINFFSSENRKLMNTKKFQILYLIFVTIINLASNLPFYFFVEWKQTASLNGSLNESIEITCEFATEDLKSIFSLYDTTNSILFPFLLMLTSSLLSIYAIYKSRKNIARYTNKSQKNRVRREIKFAITTVFLNFVYLIMCLPNSIFAFTSENNIQDEIYKLFHFTFLMSYGVNFYLFLLSNSLFRTVFVEFFHKNSNSSLVNRSIKT